MVDVDAVRGGCENVLLTSVVSNSKSLPSRARALDRSRCAPQHENTNVWQTLPVLVGIDPGNITEIAKMGHQ